jgi:hypothetical protein
MCGGASGDGPQCESGCHHSQLDHRYPFEPDAVGHAHDGVGPDHDAEYPSGQDHGAHDGNGHQAAADGHGHKLGQHAGSDRTVALVGVLPIGLGVEGVVHEVRTRCHDTEEGEGAEGMQHVDPTIEDTSSGRRHEDKDVLAPLAGPKAPKKMMQPPLRDN